MSQPCLKCSRPMSPSVYAACARCLAPLPRALQAVLRWSALRTAADLARVEQVLR